MHCVLRLVTLTVGQLNAVQQSEAFGQAFQLVGRGASLSLEASFIPFKSFNPSSVNLARLVFSYVHRLFYLCVGS